MKKMKKAELEKLIRQLTDYVIAEERDNYYIFCGENEIPVFWVFNGKKRKGDL